MFLSLSFLLFDGIKALGITLTDLTPSASCVLHTTLSFLPLVFALSSIVFFCQPLRLQLLSLLCSLYLSLCFLACFLDSSVFSSP